MAQKWLGTLQSRLKRFLADALVVVFRRLYENKGHSDVNWKESNKFATFNIVLQIMMMMMMMMMMMIIITTTTIIITIVIKILLKIFCKKIIQIINQINQIIIK